MIRDAWKASMIREHNELGGPTSTNLSSVIWLLLATAVVGAFFLALGH